MRLLVWLFLLPISLIDTVFKKWINLAKHYMKPLDPFITDAFINAFVDLTVTLGINVESKNGSGFKDYDVERLILHSTLEQAPAHLSMIRNYLVLYGFLRAVTFVLVLIFWGIVFHSIAIGYQSVYYLLTVSLIAFICYASYLKFFLRYSKDSIMATIAVYLAKKENSKPTSE